MGPFNIDFGGAGLALRCKAVARSGPVVSGRATGPNGTFIDAAGNATELAPSCVNLTLQPSVFMDVGNFAIVSGARTFILRRAKTVPTPRRYLDRTAGAAAMRLKAWPLRLLA